MVEKVAQIDVYITQQFRYFLEKLRSTGDGDGSLLDHCMVMYGAGMGDGNLHTHNDLPIVVAGGGLEIRSGRNLVYPKNTPLTNLFLRMLDRMSINVDNLGDSTGRLEPFSDV
jgi:hypothetical protein